MSFYKWALGLILFDIFMILIVLMFAMGGEDVGNYDYENVGENFTSEEELDFESITIFDTFTVRFFEFPAWFYLFFGIYQVAMITIIVGGFIRGI